MTTVINTKTLVADDVITSAQAAIIDARGRETMVTLGINAVLCAGIIAATLGLIAFLADPLTVAVTGVLLLGAGFWILAKGSATFQMFGNAAALIGSGMLIGGSFIELTENYDGIAGPVSLLLSLPIIALAARSLTKGGLTARFVAGAILLMGVALHLAGLFFWMHQANLTGFPVALSFLYATLAIFAAGWITDVRFVTALAIAPFAQVLDTSTNYFHAAYVFYSPESTLSILQMIALIVACVWIIPRVNDRTGRHLGMIAILGFVIANLCALVGSLWGDVIGSHIWGPRALGSRAFDDYSAYREAIKAFEAHAITISENVYTVIWALALVGIIFWAAHRGKRGFFNAAVTFAAIHAYTQMFETFYDEPLAYVIGGFAAIPLAWSMWRLNGWFVANQTPPES